MSIFWLSGLIGAGLLVAAIPYVMRIRHPRQKPLAAYLIFVFVLVTFAAVLFRLLVWLAGKPGLAGTQAALAAGSTRLNIFRQQDLHRMSRIHTSSPCVSAARHAGLWPCASADNYPCIC
jgi:hypothetical protein